MIAAVAGLPVALLLLWALAAVAAECVRAGFGPDVPDLEPRPLRLSIDQPYRQWMLAAHTRETTP